MVYFISGPKYSGKTTRMQEILSTQEGAGGFITEKVFSGELVIGYDIRDIKTGTTMALARRKDTPAIEDWAQEITHGAFRFSIEALDAAEHIINRAIADKSPALFIDELGKLEIQGHGHHNAIEKALRSPGNLYITVRDINLESAIRVFGITEYEVIKVAHNH